MPSYTPTFGAGDALAAQTLYDLKVFTDWLAANGQAGKGIITEMGVPGSSLAATDPIPGSGTGAHYDIRWDGPTQQWYEAANRANLHVTAWNASEWRVDLRAYETDDGNNKALNYRTTFSSVIENNLGTSTLKRGVNYAGGEFSDQGPNGILNRSHLSQPNAGYYYPTAASMAVLASRGINIIRLPLRWERVQPTLKAALDPVEMAAIKVVIDAANAAGISVLVDIHNYARYDTVADGTSGGVYTLGANAPATHRGSTVGGTMNDCFADLWTRLATYFKTNAVCWGYDICNEPHDLPGGVNDWQVASRLAVEAIRVVDQNVYIAVEGYSYATVPNWTSTNGPSAWLTETIPTGQTGAGSARNTDAKILWNGHHYFDPATNGNDGGFQDTYDTELSHASGQGFGPWSTSGYTPPATNNTLQTGYRPAFSSAMDAASDFGTLTSGSNTVVIPSAGNGDPGNSLRVTCTTTSDEGSVKVALGNTSTARIADYEINPASAATISGEGAFGHFWYYDTGSGNTTDFFEVAVKSSGSGYLLGLRQTSDYVFKNTGGTVLPKGTFQKMHIVVTDTDISLFLNGSTTAEAVITGSFANKYITLVAIGKYYAGNVTGIVDFDNLKIGSTVTAYAPPNGGLMSAVVAPVVGLIRGLMGWL